MAILRDDELKRLIRVLSQQIQDPERLAQIEDELNSDFGVEFLREPEILSYFPEQTLEVVIAETTWQLRIISYTKLRVIQRGISEDAIVNLFMRFVEFCQAENQLIVNGAYTIFGRPFPRSKALTLRVDIDSVSDERGAAHTVTVFVGRGDSEGTEEIDLM